MAQELHITRDGGIPLDEWKRAVAAVPGLRLDSSGSSARNPKTGVTISVEGHDGDTAVFLDGLWRPVFRYYDGWVSFKSGPLSLDDPNDPVWRSAVTLARVLGARIIGDGGEEFALPK
jgi:hypothetical protein